MQLHEATQSQRDFHEARKARLARMSPQAFNAALAAVEVEMAKPEPVSNVVKFPVVPRTDDCWIDVTSWPPIKSKPVQAREEFSRPLVDDVIRAACKHFKLTRSEITGDRRDYQVVNPRMIAMYVCFKETASSAAGIGRRFGDRDHSTALNAKWKIEERRLLNPSMQHDIDAITAQVKERA